MNTAIPYRHGFCYLSLIDILNSGIDGHKLCPREALLRLGKYPLIEDFLKYIQKKVNVTNLFLTFDPVSPKLEMVDVGILHIVAEPWTFRLSNLWEALRFFSEFDFKIGGDRQMSLNINSAAVLDKMSLDKNLLMSRVLRKAAEDNSEALNVTSGVLATYKQTNELLPINIEPVHHAGVNHMHYELKNNNHLQDELVVKLRIASAPDPDFIEVELPTNDLTYQTLVQICCMEFGLCPHQILKLRKLPNTKLRKDKDIKRLQNFQEIEIITDPANVYKHVQHPSNVLVTPANGYQSISKKDQTVLY